MFDHFRLIVLPIFITYNQKQMVLSVSDIIYIYYDILITLCHIFSSAVPSGSGAFLCVVVVGVNFKGGGGGRVNLRNAPVTFSIFQHIIRRIWLNRYKVIFKG